MLEEAVLSAMSEPTARERAPTVTAEDRTFFRCLGELERDLPRPMISPPPRTLADVANEMEAIERAWPWAKRQPRNSEADLAHHRAAREALLRLSRRA